METGIIPIDLKPGIIPIDLKQDYTDRFKTGIIVFKTRIIPI